MDDIKWRAHGIGAWERLLLDLNALRANSIKATTTSSFCQKVVCIISTTKV